MKRILSLIICFALLLSLAACGKKDYSVTMSDYFENELVVKAVVEDLTQLSGGRVVILTTGEASDGEYQIEESKMPTLVKITGNDIDKKCYDSFQIKTKEGKSGKLKIKTLSFNITSLEVGNPFSISMKVSTTQGTMGTTSKTISNTNSVKFDFSFDDFTLGNGFTITLTNAVSKRGYDFSLTDLTITGEKV